MATQGADGLRLMAVILHRGGLAKQSKTVYNKERKSLRCKGVLPA